MYAGEVPPCPKMFSPIFFIVLDIYNFAMPVDQKQKY